MSGRTPRPPRTAGRCGRPEPEPSVRLDRPEADRAVDGPVHPRLERDLRLVPARRADDREVLSVRPVVAALVAARAPDLPDVIAPISARPATRPAAGAPLGVADETLLLVILLIRGRVDEFHPAV